MNLLIPLCLTSATAKEKEHGRLYLRERPVSTMQTNTLSQKDLREHAGSMADLKYRERQQGVCG